MEQGPALDLLSQAPKCDALGVAKPYVLLWICS